MDGRCSRKFPVFSLFDMQNMMIRAISSIRAQAQVPITDSEKLSFVRYIISFYEFVHLHHVGV
jgi:hypothetical protein